MSDNQPNLSNLLNLVDLDADSEPVTKAPLTNEQIEVNNQKGWGGDAARRPAPREKQDRQTDTVAVTPAPTKPRRRRRRSVYSGPQIAVRTRPGIRDFYDDLSHHHEPSNQVLFEKMLEAYCEKYELTDESAELAKLLNAE